MVDVYENLKEEMFEISRDQNLLSRPVSPYFALKKKQLYSQLVTDTASTASPYFF